MGIMSRLHWEMFCEPEPESEYVQMMEQEYLEEERESQACRIKVKERERLVRGKMRSRGAEAAGQEGNGAH